MKTIFIYLLSFMLLYSCKKNNCNKTTITNSAPGCGGWGIIVNGSKYPSSNIPTQFQHDGIQVCADYEFYEDMRLCSCCGGTWVNIKSMTELPE